MIEEHCFSIEDDDNLGNECDKQDGLQWLDSLCANDKQSSWGKVEIDLDVCSASLINDDGIHHELNSMYLDSDESEYLYHDICRKQFDSVQEIWQMQDTCQKEQGFHASCKQSIFDGFTQYNAVQLELELDEEQERFIGSSNEEGVNVIDIEVEPFLTELPMIDTKAIKKSGSSYLGSLII